MSPPWAVTSSLFCVVWACAAPGSACGSAPATPSAAAPLSNSRRVTSMGCTSTRWIRVQLGSPTAVCQAGNISAGSRQTCGEPKLHRVATRCRHLRVFGATQTTAVDAEGAGGLKPTQEDKDAGLVGMATGFNLKDYQ